MSFTSKGRGYGSMEERKDKSEHKEARYGTAKTRKFEKADKEWLREFNRASQQRGAEWQHSWVRGHRTESQMDQAPPRQTMEELPIENLEALFPKAPFESKSYPIQPLPWRQGDYCLERAPDEALKRQDDFCIRQTFRISGEEQICVFSPYLYTRDALVARPIEFMDSVEFTICNSCDDESKSQSTYAKLWRAAGIFNCLDIFCRPNSNSKFLPENLLCIPKTLVCIPYQLIKYTPPLIGFSLAMTAGAVGLLGFTCVGFGAVCCDCRSPEYNRYVNEINNVRRLVREGNLEELIPFFNNVSCNSRQAICEVSAAGIILLIINDETVSFEQKSKVLQQIRRHGFTLLGEKGFFIIEALKSIAKDGTAILQDLLEFGDAKTYLTSGTKGDILRAFSQLNLTLTPDMIADRGRILELYGVMKNFCPEQRRVIQHSLFSNSIRMNKDLVCIIAQYAYEPPKPNPR